MGQKVIQFPGKRLKEPINQTPVCQDVDNGQKEKEDAYIGQLRTMSCQLRQIADIFEMSFKEAIADFSYIAIGDEIVSALLEGNEEDDDGEGD